MVVVVMMELVVPGLFVPRGRLNKGIQGGRVGYSGPDTTE